LTTEVLSSGSGACSGLCNLSRSNGHFASGYSLVPLSGRPILPVIGSGEDIDQRSDGSEGVALDIRAAPEALSETDYGPLPFGSFEYTNRAACVLTNSDHSFKCCRRMWNRAAHTHIRLERLRRRLASLDSPHDPRAVLAPSPAGHPPDFFGCTSNVD